MKSEKFIIMHPDDNCATCLTNLAEQEEINLFDRKIKIKRLILSGHKFALEKIKKGNKIIKYGEIIGIATEDIEEGDWIHIHNIKSRYLEVVKK